MVRTTRCFLRYRITPVLSRPLILIQTKFHFITIRALSDSDIAVRRKAAFLLNSLLIPPAPASTSSTSGTRIHGGPAQSGAPVHPNSHASMVADPASADTATETLRAVREHGMLPVIVRELTEPTPYGPDGDEGEGCDVDLEEKLMRCVPGDDFNYIQVLMIAFADCCTRMCRRMMGRSMIRRRSCSERSWMPGGPRRARASWDLGRTSCGKLGMHSHRYSSWGVLYW